MSSQEVHTPASTISSPAGSPPASLPTPPSPETGDFKPLPTPVDGDAAASSINGATSKTAGNGKRKTSRRANTAERRATHNAVERQRRETLNGRFLDLAALLPNLASVRRPSKSAIVNSSIAIIHQSRRTRLLAARELRILRAESEALRREINEWRARANLPRVEEPARSPEFLNLINPQDIEGVNRMGVDGTGAGEWWDAEGLGEMGEEERKAYELSMQDGEDDGTGEDGDEDMIQMNTGYKASAPVTQSVAQQPNMMNQMPLQQQLPQSFTRGLAFDGMPSHPALSAGVNTMYEPSGMPHGASHSLPVHPDFAVQGHQLGHEKLGGAWPNASLLLAQQQAQQWASFTPPNSAVATNGASPVAGNAFFMQQQQQQQQQPAHMQQMYGTPEMDDASSVSSGRAGSVGGSPGPFEMGPISNVPTGYGRRPSLSLNLNGATWNAQQQQPLAASGGGSRHLNALMAAMM